MSEEIDCSGTEEIVCPHCGYEHSDSWDMWGTDCNNNEEEMKCHSCEMTFGCERDFTVDYTSSKLTRDEFQNIILAHRQARGEKCLTWISEENKKRIERIKQEYPKLDENWASQNSFDLTIRKDDWQLNSQKEKNLYNELIKMIKGISDERIC